MKKIPNVLANEMKRAMGVVHVPRSEQVRWFNWLRYYLDFCLKYGHPTRDPETLPLFLQKLASKGQSASQQTEAARCVDLFREVAKNFPARGKEQPHAQDLSDWGGALVRLQQEIELRHYAKSTLRTYRGWVLRFQEFVGDKPVNDITDEDAVRYLSWLASAQRVVSTTQNQAFNALLFFFRHVLKRPYELSDRVRRARRTRYVPVVLSQEELAQVFNGMPEPYRLIAELLYGCGLRLTEGLTLRVEQSIKNRRSPLDLQVDFRRAT